MPPPSERPRYRSDWGISLLQAPALFSGMLIAAVAIAWCLKFAYFHDWYLIVLMPMFGGLALAGTSYWLVGRSACRNHWLAGVVGIASGLVAYLGYYQFCFMELLPQGALRIDQLPRFISFRIQTDVQLKVGGEVGDKDKKPTVGLNVFSFLFESLILVTIPAVAGWRRARFAYCTELRQWMKRETALLPTGSGEVFRLALETGGLTQVLNVPAANDPQNACRMTLEYATPDEGSPLDFPVYLSLDDRLRPGGKRRQTILRQVELEVSETLSFRPFFPNLSRLLESHHVELREVPAEVLPAPAAAVPVQDQAQIVALPDSLRNCVRCKGYALKVNLIGATPLVWILAGGALIGGGAWMISENMILPPAVVAIAIGAALCAWGVYIALFCLGVSENRWIERRLRTEIAQRPDAWVDPNDPEAQYVSIIPRDSFVKIKATMASDLLLLKIDEKRRQLLLEGDTDRYRIPAGAISTCESQCFYHPMDAHHQNQLWMVRLMIQVEQGLRELLISVGNTSFKPMTNARRQRIAWDACRRIWQLSGRAT